MRKVEHYSAGQFKPLLVQKTWKRSLLTCHCLIIYEEDKIILLDCGLHCDAVNQFFMGARISKNQTMKAHLDSQGISTHQVTDILITHLHPDHCGALSDFPNARIHLHEKEWRWVHDEPTHYKVKTHFTPSAWTHLKNPILYSEMSVHWNGFSASPLQGLSSDLLLIYLPGHTPGHCGYLIPHGDEIIFHAGDAFYILEDLEPNIENKNFTSAMTQAGVSYNLKEQQKTLKKIQSLLKKNIPGLRLINSHDEKLFPSDQTLAK